MITIVAMSSLLSSSLLLLLLLPIKLNPFDRIGLGCILRKTRARTKVHARSLCRITRLDSSTPKRVSPEDYWIVEIKWVL